MTEHNLQHCGFFPLPTEILLYIFKFLPAKQVSSCRRVCNRWKDIIDTLTSSDTYWMNFCSKDFSEAYETAYANARSGLQWFNIYRSLSLWPKLSTACESRDEFAFASHISDEIYGFKLIGNSMIGVHTRQHIDYYDIETLTKSERDPCLGQFFGYSEDKNFLILYLPQLHLFIFRKINNDVSLPRCDFHNVKMFLHRDCKLFYVTLDNDVYICDLFYRNVTATLIKRSPESIVSLGFARESFYILTIDRNIYRASTLTRDLIFVCSLEPNTNLMHILKHYNLLEQLDWSVYNQWMSFLNRSMPTGPLGDIATVRTYSDMAFVGSNCGMLLIYHMPAKQEFDLYNSTPIKTYNFGEREDCPVLSRYPILQIDVVESDDGHRVVAAMPKKIVVIDFTHDFKRATISKAMMPFTDRQD